MIEVADRYGVSRQTVHSWLGRYRTGGLEALADRSHRPRRCPHQMPAAVEARLCELRRRHPQWGQRRLAHELLRDGVDPPPGLTSIYRALVRNGLIQPRPRRRAKASYRRWERARPMELWQLDIVGGIWLADGRELKAVTGIDDHSRVLRHGRAHRAGHRPQPVPGLHRRPGPLRHPRGSPHRQRQGVNQIARAMGVAVPEEADADGQISLSYQEFLHAVGRMREVDFPIERAPADAWEDFVGWRINYEQAAYAVAAAIDAVPALWSGPRPHGGLAIAPIRPPLGRPPK